MTGFLLILITNAAFLAALLLTGMFRRYALHAQLIDQAGARSSHVTPTPRGGGASIVLVVIAALLVSPWALNMDFETAIALAGGGLIAGLIGWLDDHGHIRPAVRLLAHFASAIWLVCWVGSFPLGGLFAWSGWATAEPILSVLFIVWMINLYNFMDGIDGLAAGEAVIVTLGGTILLLGSNISSVALLAPPLILAAATLGFLPWNWPPARIFMGDASSGFLGFMLASLIIVMGNVTPQLGYAWAILPGVFIADATVTLVRRLLRREKVYEAHRSHAYQRWSRRIGAHLPVTLAILTATWLWLLPLAHLIAQGVVGQLAGAVMAMLPLLAAAALLGSGKGEE